MWYYSELFSVIRNVVFQNSSKFLSQWINAPVNIRLWFWIPKTGCHYVFCSNESFQAKSKNKQTKTLFCQIKCLVLSFFKVWYSSVIINHCQQDWGTVKERESNKNLYLWKGKYKCNFNYLKGWRFCYNSLQIYMWHRGINRNILSDTDRCRLGEILIHVIILHIVITNKKIWFLIIIYSFRWHICMVPKYTKENSNQSTIQNVSLSNTKHLYMWHSPNHWFFTVFIQMVVHFILEKQMNFTV